MIRYIFILSILITFSVSAYSKNRVKTLPMSASFNNFNSIPGNQSINVGFSFADYPSYDFDRKKEFVTIGAGLEYGKNIDSISGATISANAITYNVQESCRYLDLLKPILENQLMLKAMIK